jgi:hypothetical protein
VSPGAIDKATPLRKSRREMRSMGQDNMGQPRLAMQPRQRSREHAPLLRTAANI